ncbi:MULTISPECIES: alpha-hydroxy-acid oxidizing protein [Actinokineospora]|uniref:indole-3-glycerol-phosphate synthase n=1 Tax=Actinokineospora fastidiosa TaxID=1816 RepID=A0A918GSA3_9PSEU|nr:MULTISPECIES: alpha-hydroxy-acid oxidizing protein [Actinokineospora]UVS81496.1 Indole-3-glycerol phosphate synthase [Actinokineospora sp. UTMC 2448]GGS57694.1 indole-3-glycerol phosphate synthase [Actinokineospora fastidiosa]
MNGRSLLDVLASARRTRQPAVLADVKFRSPRDGALIDLDRLDAFLDALVEGGVEALTMPTDPVYFAGGVDLAAKLRVRTELPLMRKEFFCTTSQLDESVDVGFDAVQLSINTTPPDQLERLREHAERLGLEVLLGVHTRGQLRTALALDPVAVAVNNRNIVALELDPGTVRVTEMLAPEVPSDVLILSESAFFTADDVARAAAAGAEGVLIGTALAKSDDPARFVRTLREGAWLCPR